MSVKYSGDDMEAIINDFKKLTSKSVDVGIIGDGGSYSGGVTTLDVARFNEYGTSRIPARPFISGFFDANQGEIARTLGELLVQGVASKNISSVPDVFGIWAAGQTRKFVQELSSPPNSPITIELKGSSSPLIDTGQMMNSIEHEVK